MKWPTKGGGGILWAQRQPRMTGFLPIAARALAAFFFSVSISVCFASSNAWARDAAFLDPSSSGAGAGDEAVKVEPKGDIDVGDSVLNVTRHVDLFFVNQGGSVIKVEKVAVNGDGNVATEVASDDCSKQGTITPGSRCSVEVALTPSSPGPWTAEVLLTHDGAGRIARAKLMGKTAGTASTEKKDMGLALNTKEATPVNFGDVEIDGGKIVRSALMVNDSVEPITLYSIDVIEASNGLQKLDQGCAVDMELKPGESCPVTLVWTPSAPGQISTDLIIRHSGRMGFAVIPVRGTAKGIAKDKPSSGDVEAEGKRGLPSPPGAPEIEKMVGGKIPAVFAKDLGASASGSNSSGPGLYLIGTVGNRAVILKPDGKTAIVNAGDDLDLGDRQAKVVLVGAKEVDLLMDGKKKTLYLGSSPELIARASLSATKTKSSAKDVDFSTSASSAPGPTVPGSAAPASAVSGATASAPAGTSVSGAWK